MSTIVLTGGRILDPQNGTDTVRDLILEDGQPVSAPAPTSSVETFDCTDLLVVPGLIDVHTHVWDGMPAAIAADVAGVQSGVTTVVDAGSAGPLGLDDFLMRERSEAVTRVEVLMNLAATGLVQMPEITSQDDADPVQASFAIGRHRAELSGLKIRITEPAAAALGIELVRLAKRVSREWELPLMVHFGASGDAPASSTLAAEVISLLAPGDIITHVMSSRAGCVSTAPGAKHEARLAAERGVKFDIGHGVGHFSFRVADELIEAGLRPDTISTDLTKPARERGAFSLTETMSRFLMLGFSLAQVIAMTTSAPARILGRPDLASLEPGKPVDVSILRVRPGPWLFEDSAGERRTGTDGIEPVATVRAGTLIKAGPGPHDGAWLRSPTPDGD